MHVYPTNKFIREKQTAYPYGLTWSTVGPRTPQCSSCSARLAARLKSRPSRGRSPSLLKRRSRDNYASETMGGESCRYVSRLPPIAASARRAASTPSLRRAIRVLSGHFFSLGFTLRATRARRRDASPRPRPDADLASESTPLPPIRSLYVKGLILGYKRCVHARRPARPPPASPGFLSPSRLD